MTTLAPELTTQQRELLTNWVAALRSDQYEQIRGRLEKSLLEQWYDDEECADAEPPDFGDRTGFCCLGVAACTLPANVLTEVGWCIYNAHDYLTLVDVRKQKHNLVTSLPPEVVRAMGLDVRVPTWLDGLKFNYAVPVSQMTDALIRCNDTLRWSFTQIADLIEGFLLNGQPYEETFTRAGGYE